MKKKALILSKIILASLILLNLGMYWNNFHSTATDKVDFRKSFTSFAPMLQKVLPSVISIAVEGRAMTNSIHVPDELAPFFNENSPFCQKNSPFRNSPFCHLNSRSHRSEEIFHALGSGVIINSEKGYAVTNNHVIENADKIIVKLSDGRRYDAKVIGIDKDIDIALIQLKHATNLKEIKIANSDFLRVGDAALAIGSPYGLGETVTSGIISALGRSGLNLERYENFIQTDAAINRGNSGGALINLKGELIGINTAILAPHGGNIGIGFAIPGNMVKNLTEQIAHFGKIKRGSLGIIGVELNSNLAKIMKINTQKGAFIKKVFPNSAAFKSGIKSGDIIIALNKKRVSSFSALRAEISSIPVDSKIELDIFRKQKIIRFIVQLKNDTEQTFQRKNLYIGMEGIQVNNFTLHRNHCIRVEKVKNYSNAYRMGFKKNDIILTVNQNKVVNADQLKRILNTRPSILVVSVKRGSEIIYLINE